MSLPPGFQITTALLWQGALGFALLDALLLPVLAWLIKPAGFQRLKWTLVAVAVLFWTGLWSWVLADFWDMVYVYVFPASAPLWLPFFQAGLIALVVLLGFALAPRLRLHPLLATSLVLGAWGLLSHLLAVRNGIVERPPVLHGAAPAAAMTIAVFEYIFYWCLVVSLAALVNAAWRWLRRVPPLARLPHLLVCLLLAAGLLAGFFASLGNPRPALAQTNAPIFLPMTFSTVTPVGQYTCLEYEFGMIWATETVYLYDDGTSAYYNMPYIGSRTGSWEYTPATQVITFTNFSWLTATYIIPNGMYAKKYIPSVDFWIELSCYEVGE